MVAAVEFVGVVLVDAVVPGAQFVQVDRFVLGVEFLEFEVGRFRVRDDHDHGHGELAQSEQTHHLPV